MTCLVRAASTPISRRIVVWPDAEGVRPHPGRGRPRCLPVSRAPAFGCGKGRHGGHLFRRIWRDAGRLVVGEGVDTTGDGGDPSRDAECWRETARTNASRASRSNSRTPASAIWHCASRRCTLPQPAPTRASCIEAGAVIVRSARPATDRIAGGPKEGCDARRWLGGYWPARDHDRERLRPVAATADCLCLLGFPATRTFAEVLTFTQIVTPASLPRYLLRLPAPLLRSSSRSPCSP